MRFQDVRPTVYKRLPVEEEPAEVEVKTPEEAALAAAAAACTPRRLSPYLPDGVKVRSEVKAADILRTMHNRKSRRAMGMKRPRRRIGGVALITKPWQPIEEDVAA
jgi:hypothetical protein